MPRCALFMLALFGCLAATQVAYAKTQVARASGETKLQEAGPFDDDKVQTLELTAGGLALQAKFRIDDFFDRQTVHANAEVTNKTDQTLHFQYYIAFFDADGQLVGCAREGSFGDKGIAAGESASTGTCLIHLDPADIAKIKTFQAVFYVSDKPVGAE